MHLPRLEGEPGLIWGFDFFEDGTVQPVTRCSSPSHGVFRWLHLSSADHATRQWIANAEAISPQIGDLLLSPETHQRAVVDAGGVGCVVHDFERDFDVADTERIGALRIALTANLMLTTRLHPLRSADIARERLERRGGAAVSSPGQALELVIGAITANIAEIVRTLGHDVQTAEDAFFDGHHPPGARELMHMRRRLAQLHRLLTGMRSVFHRLEEDEELADTLLPTIEKLAQRLQSLDGDVLSVQGRLRLLRDEVDVQAAQRTNQNLYLLSIVTALMLPATLVTGIFGMNTGGMPLSGGHGTLGATLLALGAAGATYWLLRVLGFIRR